MKTINNISAIPNQQFQITIGDHDYEFKFIFCESFMSYNVSIDGDIVVNGFRMTNNQLLIPYSYQEVDGNFILDTDNSDPDYTQFGITQFIRWLTPIEVIEYREAWENGGS